MVLETSESSIVYLPGDCSRLINLVHDCLTMAGFQVNQSFDLREAMASQPSCTCPYHGAQDCTCQLAILLVYEKKALPVTLLIHGNHDSGEITLVNSPGQVADATTTDHIISALDTLRATSDPS